MDSTAATTAMAMMERTSRSRSSTRCATKGCSVPASSSSGSFGGVDIGERPPASSPAPPSVELLRPVLCHTGRAGQRAGADARAGLVPVRDGALLHAPLLLRMLVLGEGRRRFRQRLGRGSRILPLLLEVGSRRGHGLLHVPRGGL